MTLGIFGSMSYFYAAAINVCCFYYFILSLTTEIVSRVFNNLEYRVILFVFLENQLKF